MYQLADHEPVNANRPKCQKGEILTPQTYIDDNTEDWIAELQDTIDKQRATIAKLVELNDEQTKIIVAQKNITDWLLLVMEYRSQLEQKLGISYSGMRIIN
jgi:hypothetical protein